MSGRADIIALAQTLGLESTDAVLLDRYYSEALNTMGETDVMLEATFISLTAGTARYQVDDNVVRIVSAFYGAREILETNIIALEGVSRTWHTDTGTPLTFFEEHEDHRYIRLYPIPDVTTAPIGPVDKFGQNYPDDALLVLTANRDDLCPDWLDLPLAFGILTRELLHASSHRDPAITEAVKRLGQLTRTLGGLP